MPTVKPTSSPTSPTGCSPPSRSGDAATVEAALGRRRAGVEVRCNPRTRSRSAPCGSSSGSWTRPPNAATRSSTGSSSTADSSSSTSCTPPAATADRSRCGSARNQVGSQRLDQPNRRVLRPGGNRPTARFDELIGRVTWLASASFSATRHRPGRGPSVADQSTIAVKAKSMWGLVPVKGRFTEFSGDGQVTAPQTVSGRIDIKAASLRTGIRKRDNAPALRRFLRGREVPRHQRGRHRARMPSTATPSVCVPN